MEDGHRAHLSPEAPLASAVPPVALRVRGLPDVSLALAGRQRGRAWMLSLAVHGGILALALWGFGREVIAPSPAVRLVFVAPPSSAPLGMPEGTGRAPAAEVPPPAEEKPLPKTKPEHKTSKRLVVPKRTVKLKDFKPEPPPAVPTEEPQAGGATSAVAGATGGVTGGVVGGTLGGVTGGTITNPLRLDQVAQPPVIISRVEPDYPYAARLQGIEGQVLLEAIVDRNGRIETEIKVLKSVAMLDKAAIEAFRQWRFTPGRDANGQAVRVLVEVPIRFVLE